MKILYLHENLAKGLLSFFIVVAYFLYFRGTPINFVQFSLLCFFVFCGMTGHLLSRVVLWYMANESNFFWVILSHLCGSTL
jgi:ABC-type arginine/histidine transport system permease subunit